jgi:hypothetical protein
MGIAKDGSKKSTYTPGVDLMAWLTLPLPPLLLLLLLLLLLCMCR